MVVDRRGDEWTSMPSLRSAPRPSGAASTHTTVIGVGAPRAGEKPATRDSSEPPVASIGSSTNRPAVEPLGQLGQVRAGLERRLVAGQAHEAHLGLAVGAVSAASTIPTPARRIGTSIGDVGQADCRWSDRQRRTHVERRRREVTGYAS